jgi:hypothetical protein
MVPINDFNTSSPLLSLEDVLSSGQYLLSFEKNPPNQKTDTPRMTRKDLLLLLEEAMDVISDGDFEKPVEINKRSPKDPIKPGSIELTGRAAPTRTRSPKVQRSAYAA